LTISLPGEFMRLKISDYRVLFDRQADGYLASSATCDYHDGKLRMLIIYASDGAGGQPQYLLESNDLGRTWTEPVRFGPTMKNPAVECQILSFLHRTTRGTSLMLGLHLDKGLREDGSAGGGDVAWRPGSLIVGRQTLGASEPTWSWFPPHTHLGEQFTTGGIVLRNGRVVAPLWGSAKQGENWQCGVLLSDDDGVTWRYRRVGYVADKAIRQSAYMPAGFNEQTLFELPDGTLVSIIRGREKLGATDASLVESHFFRSQSSDGGETWSEPVQTNLAGTGAPHAGIALPDGSLLLPCRIPATASPRWIQPPDPQHKGLHLARSFDGGLSWRTEAMIQHQPSGQPFNYYYNAMNGYFVPLDPDRWMYTFGHFDWLRGRHHVLSFELRI